jgi:hypothetical protein
LLLRVTVPPADGLTFTVSVYVLGLKTAPRVCPLFIVTVYGFAEPVEEPSRTQWSNDQPVTGLAVTWTLDPWL